jgi:hypothetical protein
LRIGPEGPIRGPRGNRAGKGFGLLQEKPGDVNSKSASHNSGLGGLAGLPQNSYNFSNR